MKKMSFSLLRFFLFAALIYMASGCTFYKTVILPETSKEAIQANNYYKKTITISDSAGSTQYQLKALAVTDTSLSGVLSVAEDYHKPHLKSLRRGKANKLNLEPLNTMHIYLKEGELKPGYFITHLDNIQSIETHETAIGKSILASIGLATSIAAGVGGVGIGILLLSCNCPFVESQNADTIKFHGSLFPGAIFESLEREDYLELVNPALNEDGALQLRIFNSMPEVEYIDQLELYSVNAGNYKNVASLQDGSFVGYTISALPEKGISGDAEDVSRQISQEDGVSFGFDNLNQTDEFNSLEVTFCRKELSDHPKLTIVGKQSRQLDTVAYYLFSNIGNRYNEWVAKMDKEPGTKWISGQREKGISLHVSIKEKNKWKTVGYIDNPGILNYRKLVLDLDLSEHKDSLIVLKFESAYKIWKLDQIALSDDYKMNLEVENIPFSKVLNEDSVDVSSLVTTEDGDYYLQRQGGYVTLETNTALDQSVLFLKGQGYYHQSINNTAPPNYDFLKKMRHKMAFHELSKALDQSQKWYAYLGKN